LERGQDLIGSSAIDATAAQVCSNEQELPNKNNALMYHVCVTDVTNLCLLFPRLKINHKSHGSYTFILEKNGAASNNKCNLQGM
jgi:hypothetical protein